MHLRSQAEPGNEIYKLPPPLGEGWGEGEWLESPRHSPDPAGDATSSARCQFGRCSNLPPPLGERWGEGELPKYLSARRDPLPARIVIHTLQNV
jgi:hypothetical protein